jgi:hypothetical protein
VLRHVGPVLAGNPSRHSGSTKFGM